MSDPTDMPTMPGQEAMKSSMAAASKSMQGFADEVQRMSKDSMEQTTQTMEKLRGAKTMEEVVSIQTSYLQQAFASYAASAQRFSELMMAVPIELAKQGRATFQDGVEAAKAATEPHQG